MTLPSLTSIDRELIRRGGFHAFVKLAWEHAGLATSYVDLPHVKIVCEVLLDIVRGKRPRHVLNMPPSTGKNVLSTVMLVAYVWAEVDRKHAFQFVSYAEKTLLRDSKQLQTLLRSPWYVGLFGPMIGAVVADGQFKNHYGGSFFASSLQGGITGWHCHTQIINDPLKAQDAQSRATVFEAAALDSAHDTISVALGSRALDRTSFNRGLIMQRLHVRDPAGRAIEEHHWTSTVLPMLFESERADPLDWRREEGEPLDPRLTETDIRQLQLDNVLAWDAQYQQRPNAKSGSIINVAWFKTCRRDELPTNGFAVSSWDATFKDTHGSDFVAGQRWLAAWVGGEQTFFHTHEPFFERLDFVRLLAVLRSHRNLWPSARILLEDKANGPACEAVLREEMSGLLEMINPLGSKPARLAATAPEWANGRVILVEGDYVARWRREYPLFPAVRHDDEEDATSQAINYLKQASLLHAAMAAARGNG